MRLIVNSQQGFGTLKYLMMATNVILISDLFVLNQSYQAIPCCTAQKMKFLVFLSYRSPYDQRRI